MTATVTTTMFHLVTRASSAAGVFMPWLARSASISAIRLEALTHPHNGALALMVGARQGELLSPV